MKITRSQLKEIIREEIENLNEDFDWRGGKALITKFANDMSKVVEHLRDSTLYDDSPKKAKQMLDTIIKKTVQLKKKL